MPHYHRAVPILQILPPHCLPNNSFFTRHRHHEVCPIRRRDLTYYYRVCRLRTSDHWRASVIGCSANSAFTVSMQIWRQIGLLRYAL